MEKMTKGANIYEIYYIAGGNGLNNIIVKQNSTINIYYTYTDHLGSITAVTDEAGTIVAEQNFDAWGRKRNPANWTYTGVPTVPDWLYRGFTGHEHLTAFNLINMNGRMYDPMTGMMMSPDNFNQSPFSPSGYNGYLYCNGNPLKYTDPSGHIFIIDDILIAAAIGAIIGGATYTASIALSPGGFNNWNWGQFAKSVGIGALSGAVTYGIGEAFSNVAASAGKVIGEGLANGVAQGGISVLSGGDFFQGFASGALGSYGAWGFGELFPKFSNSVAGMIGFGALAGGIGAEATGGEFWRGAIIGGTVAGLNHAMHQIQNKFSDAQLKKMYEVYKKSVEEYATPSEFYESIGGPLGEWAKRAPDDFQNTCAARLSKALNYGGFEIPKNVPGVYLGGDGKYYFINAKAMANYLSKNKVWGAPIPVKQGKLYNGVFFQTGFTGGVTGHLDIMFRGLPANHIYETTTFYWH